ncbi:MAG: GIY-YIG nuclease family protein [Rickettsiales bacterium]|jgi:putative endonuclease|nr:GIY-YIG nuclease family protein [Rickettsiales bacterium]
MKEDDSGFVYILANRPMGMTYIGSTSDLQSRIWQHKNKFFKDSYTDKFNIDQLVYWEEFGTIIEAHQRERQLKEWHKNWKWRLIIDFNPNWTDLSLKMFGNLKD